MSSGISLGRGVDNDLRLNSREVSKKHALLRREPEGWSMLDHGSTNGTFVNETRLDPGIPGRVRIADRLRFGDLSATFLDAAGVVALDARIRLTAEPQTASRLMIRPVPVQWSADLLTRGGVGIHVRPVRPDDEASLAELFRHVSPEDLRFRFLGG